MERQTPKMLQKSAYMEVRVFETNLFQYTIFIKGFPLLLLPLA